MLTTPLLVPVFTHFVTTTTVESDTELFLSLHLSLSLVGLIMDAAHSSAPDAWQDAAFLFTFVTIIETLSPLCLYVLLLQTRLLS